MDHPARAVSERLLYQVGGWPNQQSAHRLERKIDVDHVLDAHLFHLEGGTENKPKVVRFQLRPDPLAK